MKQLKQLLLVMAIALTGFTPAQAQTPTTFTHYSEWMANTQKSYVYKSNDYWRYDDGLMYESILDTYEQYKNGGGDFTDETLKNAVKTYIDHCIDGSGNLLEKYEDNTLDDIRPARMVYKYYKLYGGNNLLKACQTVMNCAAFSDNYRVINHSTGYPWQHKSNYAHQVWLDGIFMGLPYWTLAGPDGVHSSHHTSWTANDYFNDAYNQMQITDEKTYEPEIGLWCHAWDEYFESTTNTPQYWSMKNGKFTTGTFKDYHTTYEKTRHEGRSSHCWGRAAGWYAMAIMETMDNINAVDANYTHLSDLQELFKRVIDAVWEKRDPTTGMWRCVLDVDDSTGDYKAIKDATGRENYLEATCSAMFTYCLLHGVAKGYLPASYLDKAKSSYRGLIHTFITTDGGLKLNHCMEVGGLGGTTTIDKTDYDRDGSFAYYTIEKKKANDSKGVGPFIWASLEAEKIGYNMETNSFGPIDEKTIVNFAWSKASDEITQGASYTSPTFTAKTYGNDTPLTNSETVDFASDNTSVATVGTNGTVTLAGGTGTAHITAALKEGSTYTWSGTNPTYTITVNAPDTSAPTLSSSTPTNSATNVATSGNIVLTFDENVACTTNATLTPNGGSAINLTPSVSGSTVTYSYSGLSNSTSYTFNLAANSVADLAGNKYANAINITFTTTTETDKYYILAYTEMTPAGVLTSASNSNQSLKYVKYNGSTFATTTEISSTFPTNSKNGKYSNSSITNVLNTSNWASGSGSSYATGIMLSKNTTYTLNLNSNNISKISFLCYPAGNTSSISIGGTAKTTSTKEWTLHEWSGSFTGEVLITLSNANDIYGVFVLEKASGSTPPTPSTFTLNNTVNTSGYGTVSPASVSNIPSGTTVTAGTGDNINKYTVGETTVTATPATATDEYTYTFSGWSGLPATVTANTTVTANFTRTAKEYTLAWNSNGGSELTGDYTSGTVSFGTAITAPNNPTRDGYTFNGWNSAQNGSGTAPGSTMPAANTTYYAQWTENTPVVEQVATPSITGTTPFTDNTTVTITCATSDANIYYTTNGDTPTSSCTHYTAPFSIDATTTIKAIAIKSGMTESEVASATFTKSGGGGGTSATITYNLTTNTSSTTFNSCASVSPTSGDIIASSTINKYGSAGASSSNSAKADETQKLNIDNSYTANNYYEWTFTVGNGKNFSPSQVVMKFQAVSDLVQYKVDLTDGTSTYTTNFANTVSTAETLEQLTWNITPTAELTGTVRLKLWAYKKNNSASAFRLGSPITITGTVGEASLAAPTFTAHPANATYTQGDTPTALSVTATGNPAPTYQWYKNTDNDKTAKVADQIEGATAATLPVANISTATAGTFYYYCVATNSEGTATSNSATITVNAAGGSGEPVNTTIVFKSSTKDDYDNNLADLSNGASVYVGNGIAKLIATNSVALNTSSNKYGYRCDGSRLYIVFKFDGTTDLSIQHNSNNTGERYMRLYSFSSNKELSAITSSDWSTKEQKAFTSTNTTTTWEGGQASVVTTNDGKTTWNYTTKGCLTVTWEDLPAGYYVLDGVGNEAFIYSFTANVESSAPTEAITIAEAGFSTLYKTYAVSVGDGGTAYYVSDIRNKNVVLTPFDNNIIPANTGAVIKGTFGDEVTLNRAIADEFTTTNYLLGTDTKQNIPAEKDKYYYFISGRQKQADNSYKYGWLVPNALKTTSVFSNNANKAYLRVPKSMLDSETAARMLTLVWEDYEQPIATGIDGFATDNGFIVIDDNTPLYNLSGQRVSKSYKGIVIINGKKVLRK